MTSSLYDCESYNQRPARYTGPGALIKSEVDETKRKKNCNLFADNDLPKNPLDYNSNDENVSDADEFFLFFLE